MIHSDATEKPVARARGGIANDNTVRMPGATTASSAEIAQLRTTATTRFGDRANNAEHAACSQRRPRDEPDQAREVGGVPPRRDPRTDDETDQLERFGDRRCDAACPLVEVELLVVQQRREGGEADEADGEEGERRPHPPQRRDPLHRAPALGERRRGLLGHHDVRGRAHRRPLPAPAHRFAESEGEEGEHERRNDEHHERQPPPELVGEQPGHQRPDERADGVGGAVGAVHPAAGRQRVVVGEQRVVRRVDDGLADGRSRSGDAEDPERRRESR